MFWFLWLTYLPRYSFFNYLRNEEIDNLKNGWKLYELESISDNYSYFLLIHKKLDQIIIFDYDKNPQNISVKDQRLKCYQENKKIIELIKKHYSPKDLLSPEKVLQEKYDYLKNEYNKSYYHIM